MVTPMPDEAVLLDLFSHADVHLLDGVGHLPHFERLDQTAALIPGFLGEGSP
jgi:pimeloyl-ACP methyl ester carboxylesterase